MSNFWGAHHFGCWRTPLGIWRRMWRVLVRQFGGRANRVGPPNFGADPFYPFCINKADKFAVAYAYETGASPQYGDNSETIAYDANGNITSLTRTGARSETLAYTYTSGTNELGTLKSNGSSKTFQYNADRREAPTSSS